MIRVGGLEINRGTSLLDKYIGWFRRFFDKVILLFEFKFVAWKGRERIRYFSKRRF